MKVLKIIGIIFTLIILTAAILWFVLLRAPSVEDQCEHVTSLMEKENSGTGKAFAKKCPKLMKKGATQGLMPYAEQAKCIMDITAVADFKKCKAK